ncbi:MAG: GH92 family glycosyl hydrolase [Bacteroidota bacterium]
MKKCRWLITIVLVGLYCLPGTTQSRLDYVNPFIGTSNFGTTNPGALVPQGMVSVVPFNVTGSDENTWDKDQRWWSTPYAWENEYFTGYSHLNLSGVGCPDLGVILVMPTTGDITADVKEYGSRMSQQKASPGYYSNLLTKYGIRTDVTATQRVGVSKFTFPKGKSNILIDLGNGLTNESGATIKVVNSTEIEGQRMTGTFCYNDGTERPVYFVARFSRAAEAMGVWKKMPPMDAESVWSATSGAYKYYPDYQHTVAGDSIGAYMTFNTEEDDEILVKVGVSYVSIENARKNLEVEMPGFDFDQTVTKARAEWDQTLSRAAVKGGSEEQKTIFYTALYHMQIHPNVISDVNGEYPIMESFKIGKVENGERYTVFSLWDTYRNFHPFMSLVYPEQQMDMVRSMVQMYQESGWLPKWELNSTETLVMEGDPAIPVIVDSYLRGLKNFDTEAAYEAMVKSATTRGVDNKLRPDIDFYLDQGYVPYEEEYDNSVSHALEYYIADWNLGQFAKALGKNDDYERFHQQSQRYKEYFDSTEFGMIRPRLADGTFYEAFNPTQGVNFEPSPGFHEGTAWQYTLGVPHDIPGLIRLFGGKEKFVATLQKIFDEGLFDMANEPDIHYPWLFNYVKGEEWRAQKEINRLLGAYYKNAPDGLPGNDDCGTLSAWAVFAMMGLYPVCPGDMNFVISEPVFDEVVIDLNRSYYEGEQLIIRKSGEKKYISAIEKDGRAIDTFFIDHHELAKGGVLEIKK